MRRLLEKVLSEGWGIAALIAVALASPAVLAQSGAGAKANLLTSSAPAPSAQALQAAASEATACLKCHEPIQEYHNKGRHSTLACSSCHGKLDAHTANKSTRPTTVTDPATCGGCHKPQFETLYKMNWEKTARKEKSLATGPSPNPAFDKLMMPHGFTKEHNEPRSHAFALYDQVVVDRAFGGRFKNNRRLAVPGPGRRQPQDLVGAGRRIPGRAAQGLQARHRRCGQPGVHVVQERRPHPRLGLHG